MSLATVSRTLLALLLAVLTHGFGAAQTSQPNQSSPAGRIYHDLNLQFHGYATQGLIYSAHNNWNTTDSSDGSLASTEGVVNATMQPHSKLRIGVQARYFLLGDLGNTVTLDWAQIDYKVNEHFGIRAGKVKSPTGLFNETQDIDPAQLWILLPQSIYPLASRNALLSHLGGVVYGQVKLGERMGRLEYRAHAGERTLRSDDGFLQKLRDFGISFPNGISGSTYGSMLQWATPLHGLTLGAAGNLERLSGAIHAGPPTGLYSTSRFFENYYFGSYERGPWLLAAEYSRTPLALSIALNGPPPLNARVDTRAMYGMARYKVTSRFSVGAYYSDEVNLQLPPGDARFQKDWTVATRYDFSQHLYAKFEQHWMDGTSIGYSSSDNLNLQPNDRMTLLKLGAIF